MTDTNQPIDQILDSAPTPEPAVPSADVPAVQQDTSPEIQPDSWTYKAVKTEREKRQALERRLVELETERGQWQSQQRLEQENQFFNDPSQAFQTLHQSHAQTVGMARQAMAISQHGKDTYEAVQKAFDEAEKRGDPELETVAQLCAQSGDPFAVALEWYQSKQGKQATAFPSNFATMRSTSARSGPAWTGPTPLTDIFDRAAR
jgi:hypothetical protein